MKRRLRDFHVETAQPWYTPRISLVWIPDDGPSAPWPETLLGPPRLPERWDYHGVLAQPIDGRFDRALADIGAPRGPLAKPREKVTWTPARLRSSTELGLAEDAVARDAVKWCPPAPRGFACSSPHSCA